MGGFGVVYTTFGRTWTNSLSAGVGGGAKIAITEKLFIAPEFRVGLEPLVRAMVSVGYRF